MTKQSNNKFFHCIISNGFNWIASLSALRVRRLAMTRMCGLAFCFLLFACDSLEVSKPKTIGDWLWASNAKRDAFIQAYYADEAGYVYECFNRLAGLENTQEIKLFDAAEMCITSRMLRQQRKNANR